MKKRILGTLVAAAATVLAGASAYAATAVSWLSPADGSVYTVGTSVNLTGNANSSGVVGGTGLDLMLVIDTSGSMSGANINTAKAAAVALINALPDTTTQMGIVTFDQSANVYRQLQDLTANRALLIGAVNALGAPGPATAIGSGIQAARGELLSARAIAGHQKMQVVLSDGANNAGPNPVTEAGTAWANGITVHSVGVPGHSVATMQGIATAGHGVYTNANDLSTLIGVFQGTGGNLVGLDHVDLQLPNGTMLNNYAIDGLGNFVLAGQTIALGDNTFKAFAYGKDGTSATATINLIGRTRPSNIVPEPGTMLLLGTGLVGLLGYRRRAA